MLNTVNKSLTGSELNRLTNNKNLINKICIPSEGIALPSEVNNVKGLTRKPNISRRLVTDLLGDWWEDGSREPGS